MADGRYQKMLGLPPEIPAPDYYDLLGLERGWIDPTKIADTMQQRVGALDGVDPADRDIADYLRRELQRARATLTDPGRRTEYDGQLKQKRLADVGQYVDRMLINKTLTAAGERALTIRMTGYGLEEKEIKAAIDHQLEQSGAMRGTVSNPDEEAVKNADGRLVVIMVQVADTQLVSGVRGGARKATGTFRKVQPPTPAAPPPPPPPEPAPEQPPPPRRATTRRKLTEEPPAPPPEPEPAMLPVADEPGGFVSASSPAAEEAPLPPPVEEAPRRSKSQLMARAKAAVADSAPPAGTDEAKHIAQITELNQKVAVLERTKAILQQQVSRTEPAQRVARRKFRSVLALFLIALGFIAGDCVAAFLPDVAVKVDQSTAEMRRQVAESESRSAIVWGGVGAAAALYLVIVWLSAKPGKAPFLIPTIVLTLASAAAGLLPMGEERALEDKRAAMEEKEKGYAAEQEAWKKKLADAEALAKKHADRIAELEKGIADGEKKLADAAAEHAKALAAKDEEYRKLKGEYDAIYKMVEVQDALKKQIGDMKAERVKLDEQIKALQAEVAELKKKLEKKP